MPHVPSDETLAIVNELLKGATAEGAYCLGAVCAMAWETGKEPSKGVMEVAVTMQRVKDAVELSLYHQAGKVRHDKPQKARS